MKSLLVFLLFLYFSLSSQQVRDKTNRNMIHQNHIRSTSSSESDEINRNKASNFCHINPPTSSKELLKFKEFVTKYKKHYVTNYQRKCAIVNFTNQIRMINAHNKLYDEGKESFRMEINYLADISDEDLSKFSMQFPMLATGAGKSHSQVPLPKLPEARKSVNYIQEGLVTPVGHQIKCGCCYAWSGSAVLEGQLRKCGISHEPVSIQQMIDCPREGVWGCYSGWPYSVFQWQMTGGIVPAKIYPYTDREGKCAYKMQDILAYVHTPYKFDFTSVGGNATFIKQVVSAIGPVATMICLEKPFYGYASGVYKPDKCCKKTSHAVTIVGYGTDPIEGDYWLIKNSFGATWGMNGFGKVARGSNTCITETQIQFAQIRSADGKVCKML